MFFGSKCVKVVKMCILHIYKRAGVDALTPAPGPIFSHFNISKYTILGQ